MIACNSRADRDYKSDVNFKRNSWRMLMRSSPCLRFRLSSRMALHALLDAFRRKALDMKALNT